MILRSYQSSLVKKAEKALRAKGNTMVVAATGSGKTICLSALAGRIGGRTLILQHRGELLQQNMSKFHKINPSWTVSSFDASTKSFRGDAVFAMQQTLCRHTDVMPKFDHVITDEVHHIVSPTYRRIIDTARDLNPSTYLSGFTATPARGDGKSLRAYFDNVCERITIRELVGLGFLVPPRSFVVDVGITDELRKLKSLSEEGDQREVAALMDTVPINIEVVRHWKEKAEGRQTLAFCSTVAHAEAVCRAFQESGVSADVITGTTPKRDREAVLKQFDRGEVRVLVNVAVFTEGYDNQVCSCIILLRQCSQKSTLIQMAGRGLRTVDPELYPGIVKKDCILIDFGTSILTHGDLDSKDGLQKEKEPGDVGAAPMKTCPECGAQIPAGFGACPFCGFIFEGDDAIPRDKVELMEIDILNASPFRWVPLFGTETMMIATGFTAWAGVFSADGGETWSALGGQQKEKAIHRLAVTGRAQALAAADDFLRQYETEGTAKKSKRWLDQPATPKQIALLQGMGFEIPVDMLGQSPYTKYSASAHTQFQFNRRAIERALGV